MIFLVCSVLTVGAAMVATFSGDVRMAILSLWIAGLGAGGIFLSLGAELLAVVQWIVTTLVAISFIFYAIMFGEYGVRDTRPLGKRIITALLPSLIGICFTGVIALGVRHLPGAMSLEGPERPSAAEPDTHKTAPAPQDMQAIGKAVVEDHFLSLELLSFTLFVVIVGSGVVARPEATDL